MAFGLFKNGVNSTDKRMIMKFVKWGWSIDQIASKLSVVPALVQRVINFQHLKTAKEIGEQPENVRTANIPAGPDEATLAMMHAEATGGGNGAMAATVGGGDDSESRPFPEIPALPGKPLKAGKPKTED